MPRRHPAAEAPEAGRDQRQQGVRGVGAEPGRADRSAGRPTVQPSQRAERRRRAVRRERGQGVGEGGAVEVLQDDHEPAGPAIEASAEQAGCLEGETGPQVAVEAHLDLAEPREASEQAGPGVDSGRLHEHRLRYTVAGEPEPTAIGRARGPLEHLDAVDLAPDQPTKGRRVEIRSPVRQTPTSERQVSRQPPQLAPGPGRRPQHEPDRGTEGVPKGRLSPSGRRTRSTRRPAGARRTSRVVPGRRTGRAGSPAGCASGPPTRAQLPRRGARP